MPDSNSSFIPKRGPVKTKRRAASRQVYIFNVVCWIIIVATIIASAGVSFYVEYVSDQLEAEVASLNSAIADFESADMERVQDFNDRLSQASERLDNSASILAIFNAIELYAVDTVAFNSLNLDRDGDTSYTLEANLITDSFDSTISQRDALAESDAVESILITNLDAQNLELLAFGENEAQVDFDISVSIPLTAIPYDPAISANRADRLGLAPNPFGAGGVRSQTQVETEPIDDNETDI